jgi:hypothetical protein
VSCAPSVSGAPPRAQQVWRHWLDRAQGVTEHILKRLTSNVQRRSFYKGKYKTSEHTVSKTEQSKMA